MNITNFIFNRREKALLVGDHGSYRKQLSRRLLVVRKKLQHTSMKGKKYSPKAPVTAEDIGTNHEYAVKGDLCEVLIINRAQVRPSTDPNIRASMGPCHAHEVHPWC